MFSLKLLRCEKIWVTASCYRCIIKTLCFTLSTKFFVCDRGRVRIYGFLHLPVHDSIVCNWSLTLWLSADTDVNDVNYEPSDLEANTNDSDVNGNETSNLGACITFINMDFLVMVLWAAAVVAAFDNIRHINYGPLELLYAALSESEAKLLKI